MADRTPFLLRLDPRLLEALRRWAADDMRSLNAEIEFLLSRSVREAGRLPATGEGERGPGDDDAEAPGRGRRGRP